MNEERARRKLTAILSADVRGYSRLMEEDELATIETLKKYKILISSLIEQFRGRVVDSPGDNLLAEFASVVDAVECAVNIQEELKKENDQFPKSRRMEFRIGVNLGDVVEDGARIYGDGVNIAARLEALAEPGGICISGFVYNHVKNRLKLEYEYLGEQAVKNLKEPVPVYRILSYPDTAAHRVIKVKKTAEREFMGPSFQDKPSIAVLPFVNMSNDPEQEYFSDGITEDIITELSKVRNIFVIARNSTFTYKGSKAVKVQKVAEELGVRYVLEGSVRKAGDKVRITAQLIDAISGHHLWAERYDRKLEDIFAIQDEITEEIVTALDVKLVRGEQTLLWRKSLKNPETLDLYYRGREIIYRLTKESLTEALPLFKRVIELEPDSSLGYAGAAQIHWFDAWLGWSKSPARSFNRATALAQKAILLDDNNADAHAILGNIFVINRQFEKAIAEGKRAVAISPSGADVASIAALIFVYYGRPNEAIVLSKRAMRLNPIPPAFYFNILGVSYRETKQYDLSILTLKEGVARYPEWITSRYALVATYCATEKYEEARAEAREIVSIDPQFDLKSYTKKLPFRNPAVNERLLNDLRKAGLK